MHPIMQNQTVMIIFSSPSLLSRLNQNVCMIFTQSNYYVVVWQWQNEHWWDYNLAWDLASKASSFFIIIYGPPDTLILACKIYYVISLCISLSNTHTIHNEIIATALSILCNFDNKHFHLCKFILEKLPSSNYSDPAKSLVMLCSFAKVGHIFTYWF